MILRNDFQALELQIVCVEGGRGGGGEIFSKFTIVNLL